MHAHMHVHVQAVLMVMFFSLGFLFTILFRCSYRYMFGEAADILVASNFNTFSKSLSIVFQVAKLLLFEWLLSWQHSGMQ